MSAPTIDAPVTDTAPPIALVVEDRSVSPSADRVLPATRKVLIAFAVLTLLAANQLLVVASFTDRFFAWTISVRPTSAFLGPRTRRASCWPSSPSGGTGGETSGCRWSP